MHFLDFISPTQRRWAIGAIIAGIVIAIASIIIVISLSNGSTDEARASGWFEWMSILALGLIFGVPLILWLTAKPSKAERDASAAPSSLKTTRTNQDSASRSDLPSGS